MKPKKPTLKKYPKKPTGKGATVASMKTYLSKVTEIDKANAKNQTDYENELAEYERLKKEMGKVGTPAEGSNKRRGKRSTAKAKTTAKGRGKGKSKAKKRTGLRKWLHLSGTKKTASRKPAAKRKTTAKAKPARKPVSRRPAKRGRR